jgi:hypothetical protein
VAPHGVSIIVLSCVGQMCWHRYRVWEGLVMLLFVIFVVAKLRFFFSLIFNKSVFIEGRRWTCLNMSTVGRVHKRTKAQSCHTREKRSVSVHIVQAMAQSKTWTICMRAACKRSAKKSTLLSDGSAIRLQCNARNRVDREPDASNAIADYAHSGERR